jgi:hypothetical protein
MVSRLADTRRRPHDWDGVAVFREHLVGELRIRFGALQREAGAIVSEDIVPKFSSGTGQVGAVVKWLGGTLRTLGVVTFAPVGPPIPYPVVPIQDTRREALREFLRRHGLIP